MTVKLAKQYTGLDTPSHRLDTQIPKLCITKKRDRKLNTFKGFYVMIVRYITMKGKIGTKTVQGYIKWGKWGWNTVDY